MNKLQSRSASLKPTYRRWIRTGMTLTILGILIGFAWKPRLVTENYLRDATHVMVTDSEVAPAGPPVADLVREDASYPKADSPRHRWYIGGFPLDAYQARMSHNEGVDGLDRWSTFGLGLWIDVWFCIGVLALAGIAAYHIRPGQSPWNVLWSPNQNDNTRYRRALVGIASIGLIATAFHFYETQRRLRTFERETMVTLVRSTDHPIVANLPLAFRGPWTHAFQLQCHPESNLESIDWSNYKSLDFIALTGDIDQATLLAIQENPWVTGLRWSNVPSVEAANSVLAQLPSLRSVSMSFRSGDEESGQASDAKIQIQSLDRLASLSLRRIQASAICTEDLLVPSLTMLEIQTIGPSPESWLFEDANRLQSLSVRHLRPNRRTNADELKLTVRLMPALTELSIDAGIPVDLSLLELPRLAKLHGIDSYSMRFSNAEGEDGYIARVSSLKMSGLSSLTKLELAGENFDDWEIEECPRLHDVRITRPAPGGYGRFRRGRRGWEAPPQFAGSRFFASAATGPAPLPQKSTKGLMAWSASLPSLRTLNFDGMDLTTCELSKLKTCSYLKSLTLENCQLEPRQLEELQVVSTLRELSVSGAEIDPEVFPQLLAMHSNWEVLALPWEELEEIRIIDQPQLRRAFGTRNLRAKHIELVNLNSLVSRLRVAPGVETVRVVNLPRLTEIDIRRPQTDQIEIERVPHLLSFTLERGVLNSTALSSLTQSRQLHSLILPGTDYPEGLGKHFASWPGLQEINVMGTTIGDDDLRELPNLKNLRRLRLDYTALTEKGISTLARCARLQSVSLMGLELSSAAFEPLSALSWLMELSVNESISLPDALQSIRLMPDEWAAESTDPRLAEKWFNGLRPGANRGTEFSRRRPHRGRHPRWVSNEEKRSNEASDSRLAPPPFDAT
ncbi:leucine-rich repeat domain-containing protein [Rhodopirellula europaea]|uniref:Adenylate cyclase regulatory protein n=1 Tax=Rhodopirellula europaea SH398 TaxID=1263868 RepID=M5S7Y0_9BACT|nr:adenylate cyclase [Rhodopirellula europaea]EMI27581.1 adenylate cyclase regulatory protein [Rhodopirellula europaea SH398]